MHKYSMASAGAVVFALGTIGIAPAEAVDLTKLDYTGSVTLDIVSPFPTSLSYDLDTSVTVDLLSERLADEELTVPLTSYIQQVFPDLFSQLPPGSSLDAFAGTGSIYSDAGKTAFLSGFAFSYSSVDDILTVNGFDFPSIQSCLNSTCYIDGSGSASGTAYGFPVSAGLNFDITQTATPLPDDTNVEPYPDSTGEPSDSESVPEPTVEPYPHSTGEASDSESVPEPAVVFGLMSLGGFFALRRKSQKLA